MKLMLLQHHLLTYDRPRLECRLEESLGVVAGFDAGLMLLLVGVVVLRAWWAARNANNNARALAANTPTGGGPFEGIISQFLHPVLRMFGGIRMDGMSPAAGTRWAHASRAAQHSTHHID